MNNYSVILHETLVFQCLWMSNVSQPLSAMYKHRDIISGFRAMADEEMYPDFILFPNKSSISFLTSSILQRFAAS